MDEYMSDREAVELLRLLHKYLTLHDNPAITISELAEDLAMSMDVTSDEADQLRREIEFIAS